MLDPHSGVPLHRQLADELRGRIRSGEWPPGRLIPSEPRLSQEYGVGRGTARRAFALLRAEGLVESAPGRGTWVREPVAKERVSGEVGQLVECRMPTPEERAMFDMPEGVPVLVVTKPGGWPEVYPGDQYAVIIP